MIHHCSGRWRFANFTTATNALKGAGGALKAVNDEINNITDLDASGTTNILSAASRLAGQVKASSQAGNTTAVDNLKTNISALITEAGNNTAPSAITVTSPSWDKATQTFSSTLSATDAEGDSITYSLTGPDEKLFTVSGSNISIQNPAKDNYSLIVTATDDAVGGTTGIDISASSSEAMFVTMSEDIVEDSGSYTIAGKTKTDSLTGDITYSVAGATNGVVSGTFGSLTFNSQDGSYSYTANNDSAAVQGLKAKQYGTDFFVISAQDSKNFITEVVGFQVAGETEALSVTSPTNNTLTEGATTTTVTGALTASGLIDGESTAAYGIDGVTPGQSATTVVKQGTYGVLTVTIADGTFSYVIDSERR